MTDLSYSHDAPSDDAADDPLDRLLNDAVDRGLSDAEEADLAARLRDDPAARERYRRFMSLHAELHWRAGAQAASSFEPTAVEPTGEPAATPVPVATPDRVPEAATKRDRSGRTLAAACALAMAAGLAAIALLPGPWPGSGAPDVGGNGVQTAAAGTNDAGMPDAGVTDAGVTDEGAERGVATVVSVQGAVRFRGADGRSRPATLAATLPAGTALVEGASSVQLQFADGTLVSVGGDAEVEFDERPTPSGAAQKRLRLRSGLMTAEVRPQPPAAPMVIETPTARAEVLGTVFTLAAGANATRLDVEDGLVRLRRLVDGRSVEVPAGRRVVASLDAAAELRSQAPAAGEPGWRHVFEAPQPTDWRGRWLAPEGNLPGRVRAVPLVVGRTEAGDESHAGGEGGAPIVHFGVTARRTDEADLGTLPRDAVLSAVIRSERPTPLRVFLGVLKRSGRFGGNFETLLPAGAGVPLPGAAGEAGWRRISVPLASMRPLVPRHSNVARAARPMLMMLTCGESDDGLEVAELALTSPEHTTAGENE